jgi:hypothetical protein
MAFGQFLAGCVTFPGELARPDYVARIVDREYSVTWNTLVAALRNEGAALQAADKQAGIIETAYSSRPGTKVRTRGPFVHVDTQSVQVRVRYSVRANPLGSERTEVRLRTEVQYQDGAKGWVATTDDGGVAESFWRRFHQDLAYYGLRPETWGAQEPRRDPGPSGPTAPGDPEGRAGGAPSGR